MVVVRPVPPDPHTNQPHPPRDPGPHGPGHHHGGKNKSAQWLNPPFAPETRAIGAPSSKSQDIYRGAIIADAKNVSGVHGKVRFMYNPSNLEVSHAINTTIPIGEAKNQALDVAQSTQPFGNIPTLTLYFDRTYELWQRGKGGLKDLGQDLIAKERGVEVDVVALYRMLGIAKKDGWEPVYPLAPSGVHIVIGRGNRLKYYGIVESLGVNYTSWTQDMTPRRCEVTLSFILLNKKSVRGFGANDRDGGGTDGLGNYFNGDGTGNGTGGNGNFDQGGPGHWNIQGGGWYDGPENPNGPGAHNGNFHFPRYVGP